MVRHIYIFLIGDSCSIQEIFLYFKMLILRSVFFFWRRAVLASFDASEARSSERSMRTWFRLTVNAWASGPIVIPMTLKICNMAIKPSLKIHTARKVEIWIFFVIILGFRNQTSFQLDYWIKNTLRIHLKRIQYNKDFMRVFVRRYSGNVYRLLFICVGRTGADAASQKWL